MVKLLNYENIEPIKEYVNTLRLDKSSHTIRYYLGAIDRFFSFYKIEKIEDIVAITPNQCREYQAKLKEDELQASSINAHIRTLKALFNWLVDNEYIEKSPFEKVKKVKEIKKEASYMSEEEITQLFSNCKNDEEKAMFALFIRLGLRREELANLKVGDIDGDIVKVIGKGEKLRILGMPEDAYELYLKYMKNRSDNEYIFVSRITNTKYTGEAIRLKFKAIMKRAGFSENRIKELHPHSLRHTFMANFMENGDIKVAQAILGHSQMSTTANIYAHIRNSVAINATRNQKRLITHENN
jgi:site-specific recombinase XerD